MVEYREHIWVDPERRNGLPCVKGTRIAVQDLLDYLLGGMSEHEILEDFPDLTPQSIAACIAYGADRDQR